MVTIMADDFLLTIKHFHKKCLLEVYIRNILTARHGALQLLSVDVRNKLSMNVALKNKRIGLF